MDRASVHHLEWKGNWDISHAAYTCILFSSPIVLTLLAINFVWNLGSYSDVFVSGRFLL
jgi:hypothetical protein